MNKCIATIFVVSSSIACQTTPPQNDGREIATVNSMKVVLLPGVASADLGLSLDQRAARLSTAFSQRSKVAVSEDDVAPLTDEDAIAIIDSTIGSLSIPDLLEPTSSDIDMVRADFPELSDDDIHEQWDAIRDVYLDQLSGLSLNNVIDEVSDSSSTPEPVSEAYGSNEITIHELAAMISHPFSALGLVSQRQKAFDLTAQYMGEPDRTDDKSDAFRHAIWNITMAKMGWGLKRDKIAWATDFGHAHEMGGRYNGMASEMDWHNNIVGVKYYDAKTSITYSRFLFWDIESGVREPSYTQASNAIKEKAIAATLVSSKAAIAAVTGLVYIKTDSHTY